MADAYSTLGSYHVKNPREVLPLARQSAAQALSIDEHLAEAHASMGKILTDYYWDWAQAERELQRAIELNPNYANAHNWYSTLLVVQGRFDEALREANRALELIIFRRLPAPNWAQCFTPRAATTRQLLSCAKRLSGSRASSPRASFLALVI